MNASEKLTVWLAQLRASGRVVLLTRMVVAVAGAVALVVPAVQSWDEMDLVPLLGVPLLVAGVVLPDSLAALLFIVVVTGGWFVRAPGEITWGLAVTAVALVVLHLATSFAGQLPSYARVHRDALRRWWLPTAIAVLLVPVVEVAASLVQHAHVAGSLLVTVAALALATLTIWFTAAQNVRRD